MLFISTNRASPTPIYIRCFLVRHVDTSPVRAQLHKMKHCCIQFSGSMEYKTAVSSTYGSSIQLCKNDVLRMYVILSVGYVEIYIYIYIFFFPCFVFRALCIEETVVLWVLQRMIHVSTDGGAGALHSSV